MESKKFRWQQQDPDRTDLMWVSAINERVVGEGIFQLAINKNKNNSLVAKAGWDPCARITWNRTEQSKNAGIGDSI